MALSEGDRDMQSTVYAKPFSKNVTAERVGESFAFYGRILSVELRKDESGSFRGSVFVTFADPSSAASAVANPPLQLGSSLEKLQVMLRSDYERKVASKPSKLGSDSGASKHRSSHKSHNGSSGKKRQRDQQDPSGMSRHGSGSGSGYGSGAAGPSGAAAGTVAHSGRGTSSQGQQDAGVGVAHGASVSGAASASQAAHWQALAEQREQRIKELEERARADKEAKEAAIARANQAVFSADEAQARERVASQRLLAKEAEAGSLKGEVATLRSAMASRVQEVQMQYKARMHDMEAQIQQLKDENKKLKQRLQRQSNPSTVDAAAAYGEDLGADIADV